MNSDYSPRARQRLGSMYPDKSPPPTEKAKRRSAIVATVLVTVLVMGLLGFDTDHRGGSERTAGDEIAMSDGISSPEDVPACRAQMAKWVEWLVIAYSERLTLLREWFPVGSRELQGINTAALGVLSGFGLSAVASGLTDWCDRYLMARRPVGKLLPLVAQDPCAYLYGEPPCTENPMAQALATCTQGRVLADVPHCDPRLYFGG